jgi:hypothetical protein
MKQQLTASFHDFAVSLATHPWLYPDLRTDCVEKHTGHSAQITWIAGVAFRVHDRWVTISRQRQAREVDGNHILYHFLQKGLLQEDVWLFQMLTARLVASLGIWFPLRTYAAMPFLAPYAVRDSSCRKDAKTGRPEAWGSPNSTGYFRDDNSLIKNIPSSLPIESRFGEYAGARMGNGFVASHVWRRLTIDGYASQHSLTNSFIPNLVWLPAQVSKLSDRKEDLRVRASDHSPPERGD